MLYTRGGFHPLELHSKGLRQTGNNYLPIRKSLDQAISGFTKLDLFKAELGVDRAMIRSLAILNNVVLNIEAR